MKAGLLENIAAVSRFSNAPCCEWLGENSAVHFVKMVHNGIGYSDMAIISETYLILRSLRLSNLEGFICIFMIGIRQIWKIVY